MENTYRHEDDGVSSTRHKMKGRQRCPKCFCGLEGSQRSIDLLKRIITASFTQCDGAIRAPGAVSGFLENEKQDFQMQHQEKPLISQTYATASPSLQLCS